LLFLFLSTQESGFSDKKEEKEQKKRKRKSEKQQ